MRLGLTNLAWAPDQDEAVARLMQQQGIDAVDVAPSKYFEEPLRATGQAIAAVRRWWADRGIEITGMQSLLFNTEPGLNLFGAAPVRQRMLERLTAVCRIAAGLGAPRLVFGSWRNRDRRGLMDAEADAIALDFFGQLAERAAAEGVWICLEGVAPHYGANYLTDTASTLALARQLDHPAIRVQLDTVTIREAGEDIDALLAAHAGLIGHVHVCERDLLPIGDGDMPHDWMAAAIRRHLPDHVVCLEMLTPAGEAPASALTRAILVARQHYVRHAARSRSESPALARRGFRGDE
ncbi:MAG: sugar phosphate isomerase/epimerase family protein [Lautropia sp.]|nr:sugar phosphate isomerase/epimerase family protein [Lautropia sp.]